MSPHELGRSPKTIARLNPLWRWRVAFDVQNFVHFPINSHPDVVHRLRSSVETCKFCVMWWYNQHLCQWYVVTNDTNERKRSVDPKASSRILHMASATYICCLINPLDFQSRPVNFSRSIRLLDGNRAAHRSLNMVDVVTEIPCWCPFAAVIELSVQGILHVGN